MAVAVADFLDGVSERQVPKWTDRSLRKPPPAAMGRSEPIEFAVLSLET